MTLYVLSDEHESLFRIQQLSLTQLKKIHFYMKNKKKNN